MQPFYTQAIMLENGCHKIWIEKNIIINDKQNSIIAIDVTTVQKEQDQ